MIAKSVSVALVPFLAVIFSLSAGPARAAVCLDQSMTLDEIVGAINAVPGCERAMTLFKACELGSSGDIWLGAAAEKKCEGEFLARMKRPQRDLYQSEMQACDRKYQNDEGTMYRSFTAFCRAEVARRYAQQARKVAFPSPAR